MEKELEEIEVKIISTEMVKPSLPPPSNPTTFTLSLIDQIFYPCHVPLLLYYNANSPTPQGGVDIGGMKASLSQTLDQFLPLAGRLLDESTISCNHEGIPFIETKVDCDLSVALTSPQKLKFLTKLLPPPELQASGLQPISEIVPLAFQINVFLCGGVVIGCYMLHKFLDTSSLGTFLKYWSALTSNRSNDLAQPNFEASINAFPPQYELEHKPPVDLNLDLPPTQSNSISMIKNFIFYTTAINKLRSKATTDDDVTPKPTGFEVVAGFVWEQTMATKHNLGLQVDRTPLLIAVNMRPRMNPPLPKESMGNVITMAHVLGTNESNNFKLQELVTEIHSTLLTTYENIFNGEFQRENAKAELQRSLMPTEGALLVTSWCKMGLNEADFGFGKPIWIVPTDGKQPPPVVKSILFLTDYCHPINGEGIEAWLMLDEAEMQNLESNPEFLALASPN